MRILHVVTLASNVGAFGGPTTVALNECLALRARGHETLLVGGAHGFPTSTTMIRDTPVRLFRTHQIRRSKAMAYLWSPTMLWWLRRHMRDFDVVHIHLARDGITLPTAAMANYRRQPYVVQTHGMVEPRKSLLHKFVDLVATRRVLRGAGAVFSLSYKENGLLSAVAQSDRQIDLLPNAIPAVCTRTTSPATPRSSEFLFLARLHPRKRALNFVDAAMRMLTSGSPASFTIIGPDEGDAAAVDSRISEFAQSNPQHADALRWLGPVAPHEALVRMKNAYAYVLPSVDEPFPMSVIEALAAGLPVVISESNGLADVVKQYDCGIVIPDDSVEALVDAMQQLLAFPDQVARMGQQATVAVRDEFSMETVAERLVQRYREIARQPQKEDHSQ